MVRKLLAATIPALAVIALAFTSGCSKEDGSRAAYTSVQDTKAVKTVKNDDDHGHRAGSHGGIIIEIGRDNYHAEAVFEKGGALRLYTLGKDEAQVQEVEAQTLVAFVKMESGADSEKIVLAPEPQAGDAAGQASRFVGQLPDDLVGQKVEVTVPNIRIKGERFRFGFTSKGNDAHADGGMPPGVSNDEEKKLYLTPGGKYSDADIQANGGVTASHKFKGIMAKHDMKPKPGDRICPITMTKANPKFSWIVGGKSYEFCCPPCVDEFLKAAKEHPSEIKDPSYYVKQ